MEQMTFATRMLDVFAKDGKAIQTGRRGRPVVLTFDKLANNIGRWLFPAAREIAEEQPFQFLQMLYDARRLLTIEEKDSLENTPEGEFQGMRDGEPIQTETRASLNIAIQGRESFSDAVQRVFEDIALPLGQTLAKRTERPIFIRYERWAAARAGRAGDRNQALVPKSLSELPARYQGIIYLSDSPVKKGFLTLGVVFPSGREHITSKAERELVHA